MKHIGNKQFTKYSLAIYNRPNSKLIKKAQYFLSIPYNDNDTFKVGKITIVKKFLDACAHHRFNCEIIEKEMVAKAAVNTAKKRVYFNSNHPFTETDLQRLAVHEIGTHIKRGEHARKQKLKLFSIGFQGYLQTEEGLAVYNEEQAGLLTPKVLRQYAGRVIAVDLSLKNSFSVVYSVLIEYFPPEEAFAITLRSKRGLSDTSKPGGYTKDFVYLQGWYDIKTFIKNGGNIKDLYTGKIGVQHVPYLRYIQRELGL